MDPAVLRSSTILWFLGKHTTAERSSKARLPTRLNKYIIMGNT